MITRNEIDQHLSLGRQLFPLRAYPKADRKKPLEKGFNTKRYSALELYEYAEAGHGLGWWLGPNDLVIDYDPRDIERYPKIKQSHKRLIKRWEKQIVSTLQCVTPMVHSGGEDKGLHYYIKLPLGKRLARTKWDRYPGLQFWSSGHYMVLPGSRHNKSDKLYEWAWCSPVHSEPIEAPDWLVKGLCDPVEARQSKPSGPATIDEITYYLKQLDPCDYRSRMDWLNIGFCVHNALGDEGRELFFKWSARDAEYDGCEEQNEKIWDSIKDDKSKMRTKRSLIHEVLKAGGRKYVPFCAPIVEFEGENGDNRILRRANQKLDNIILEVENDNTESRDKSLGPSNDSSLGAPNIFDNGSLRVNSSHNSNGEKPPYLPANCDLLYEDGSDFSATNMHQCSVKRDEVHNDTNTRKPEGTIKKGVNVNVIDQNVDDSDNVFCDSGSISSDNDDSVQNPRTTALKEDKPSSRLQKKTPSRVANTDTVRPEVEAPSLSDEIEQINYLDRLYHLPLDISEIELLKVIKESFRFDKLKWFGQFRMAIKKQLKLPLSVVDELYQKARKLVDQDTSDDEESDNLGKAERVALEVQKKFPNLISATNQRLYIFKRTHWEALEPNIIKKIIYGAAKRIKISPDNVFSAAENILIARTAVADDVFRFLGPLPPVINTKSKEVWINFRGDTKVMDHRPESHLTTCLDVEYKRNAQCEIFHTVIDEIFSNDKELVRHWFETLGYMIQPVKNIPSWFMWHGSGANGKTLLLDIVQCLLGDAFLSRPLAQLKEGSNAHAITSLVNTLVVADDDANVTSVLPAAPLKKLSEGKMMEANPKFGTPYQFKCTATPIVLINDWPKLDDISHGMIRKTFIIPFRRTFSEEEQDIFLLERIKKFELSGILNLAIDGYQRLRRRGRFLEPEVCKEAKKQWLKVANPLYDFTRSVLRPMIETGDEVNIDLAFDRYMSWCRKNNLRWTLTLLKFEDSLKHLGFKTVKGIVKL